MASSSSTTPSVQMISSLLLFGLLGQFCTASKGGGGGFSVDLIHRDSPKSPLYNPSLSLPERLRAAVQRTHARAGALSHRVVQSTSSSFAAKVATSAGSIVSQLVTNSFEYLMTINIGTPSNKILAIADTGSDLVWVNCANSNSDAALAAAPLEFDPSNSTTYDLVSCQTGACRALTDSSCDNSSNCQYLYAYGDRSQTTGLLSTETFTFDTTNGRRQVHVPNITFGCSTNSSDTFHAEGLVGLGGGPVSLITQLGASIEHKFSYCIIPLSDNSSSSVLNFGSNAVVSEPNAVTTALIDGGLPGTFYAVTLEGIKLGGKTVTDTSSTIIVDSGTTLTYLDSSILQSLVEALGDKINLPQVQPPNDILQLCYNISGAQQSLDQLLPEIVFEFTGAPVALKTENAFVLVDQNTVCLAVSSGLQVSILGNIAQQNFHVGYDLERRTVSFAATDCTKS